MPTQANGVYVHGGNTGGIAGRVYLDGSDGATLAAPITHGALTDVVALRLAGEAALADLHATPRVQSVSMPFSGPGG